MVPDLNWALNWDFFGSQEIWALRNLVPKKFGPLIFMEGLNFSRTKYLGDRNSQGSNFLGTNFLGDQISLGPNF